MISKYFNNRILDLLLSPGLAACCTRTNTSETSAGRSREFAFFFIQEAGNPERSWTCAQITNPKDTAWSWNILEGLVRGGGQSLQNLPLCADFLLIGWQWGTRVSSKNLGLSLKLPSSTWVGTQDIVMYIPWGGIRTLPHSCPVVFSLLLLFSLYFFLSLISNWLNLPCGTQGRSEGWMEPVSYKQKTGDTERIGIWEGPTRPQVNKWPGRQFSNHRIWCLAFMDTKTWGSHVSAIPREKFMVKLKLHLILFTWISYASSVGHWSNMLTCTFLTWENF